jgi:hypothetical protein
MFPKVRKIVLGLLLLLPLIIAYRQFQFHRYGLMLFWLIIDGYLIYCSLSDNT